MAADERLEVAGYPSSPIDLTQHSGVCSITVLVNVLRTLMAGDMLRNHAKNFLARHVLLMQERGEPITFEEAMTLGIILSIFTMLEGDEDTTKQVLSNYEDFRDFVVGREAKDTGDVEKYPENFN